MFLIKPCPSCRRKIRFPIDKGKIKVNCICGYNFIADPDNPDIYKNGEFDLKGSKSQKKTFIKKMSSFYNNLSVNSVINRLYNIKYKFQNFRLLPASEQKKIIMSIISLFILAIMIIYFFKIMFGSEVVGDHVL